MIFPARISYTALTISVSLMSADIAFAQTPPATPQLAVDISALATAIEGLRSKPSDTIKANGGDMEAAILSAGAIREAGMKIASDTAFDSSSAVIVVGQDEPISVDTYIAFEAERQGIESLLNAAKPQPVKQASDPESGGALPVAAIGAVASLFSSLFRSETEISSLAGGLTSDRLLALEVARAIKRKGKASQVVVPSAIVLADASPNTNPVLISLNNLAGLRDNVAQKADPKNPAAKAALARYDTFLQALTTRTSTGEVPLVAVMKAQTLAQLLAGNAIVVRVEIDKSGGTLLIRKNILVALGASAIGVSGGLVASYSATTPRSGSVEAAGLVVCRTGVMPFKRVHTWDGSKTNCAFGKQ